MFIFGDSLVEVGNNNYLSSIAKSNYFPYGVDFNRGPTGRFCNGKTFVDILAELLGLPYPPAFADPNTAGARLLGGVNYASAAAGILDETGQHYVSRNMLIFLNGFCLHAHFFSMLGTCLIIMKNKVTHMFIVCNIMKNKMHDIFQ
ncbi:unnamed protein product [Linum tenue]|uniref:GDSL esterase/lipase n=1 Tax=Linum tenue TaxID=586396 RepID=A0AAV0RFH9_9ROSI|nr:unnamed protein product [Linum tenue]